MGRATQGVKIIRLRDEDSIASVAKVSKFEEDEVLLDDEGNVIEIPQAPEDEISSEDTTDSNDNNNEQNNTQITDENEEN